VLALPAAGLRLREVDQHVQRRGPAQVLVDERHALVDRRGLVEVVDEAVLHRQPVDADGRHQCQHGADHQRPAGSVRGEAS
ncbi:hypothetical protein DF186_23285, partial [Enterococcus hirae]